MEPEPDLVNLVHKKAMIYFIECFSKLCINGISLHASIEWG